MNIIIHTIPAFNDNYLWLFHSADQNDATVVDPGDATPILKHLKEHHLHLANILVTHQHADHIGGIAELTHHYPECIIYGPADISLVNHPVDENSTINASGVELEVIAVPGHTLNHLAYYASLPEPRLFCGDTLFAGGCGRLFEGTAQQMYESLNKLLQLPDNTLVYCAHEYTQANLAFATAVEPDNAALADRVKSVSQLREQQQPTVPTTIGMEKQTNPFLRFSHDSIRNAALAFSKRPINDDVEVFAAIRQWKDNF